MSEESTHRRALDAVARTRAMGPHFFGNFVGITGTRRVDHARLRLDVEPGTDPGAPISPMGLATVVDLTLSAAIRSRLAVRWRLGTIAMTIHHLEPVAAGPLSTHAVAPRVEVGERRGFAHCDVVDLHGNPVAAAEGWFVALPTAPGKTLAPVPWDLQHQHPVPPVTAEELTSDEHTAVADCEAAARRAASHGTSPIEELLAGEWSATGVDAVRGRIPMSPVHANRGGHMQGGILYGAAVLGARRVVTQGMSLADGHLQFVAPADQSPLTVDARALRQGRRTSFIEVRLTTDERLVATGAFTFHRVVDAAH